MAATLLRSSGEINFCDRLDTVHLRWLQGYLAHKKQPTPPRALNIVLL